MRRLLAVASVAALLPFAAAMAAPLSKVDQTFVKKAAIGGMAEVQEGQAAVSTASSADVKAYGQKMVDAHTANNQELATLASSKGATVPTELDTMHAKELDALTKKTGTAFDAAYVKDQTKGHESMEKVMQTEIDHGEDADLKAFASKTLPVVQEHLKMVQGLKG